MLLGNTVIINGTLSAAGETPPPDTSLCGYRPGGGGGSGGSVVVRADTLSGAGLLRASGGNGGNGLGESGSGTWGWSGGGGGGGRVKVFTTTNNFTGTNNVAGGAGGAQCPASQCFGGSPGTAGTSYSGTIPQELSSIGCQPLQTDLAITKTDNSTTAVAGTPVTYTIQVTNAGPSNVTGASVTDTLPVSLTGASWTCVAAGSATCTAMGTGNLSDTVTIPVGDSVTYTLTATLAANATGMIENSARVEVPSGMIDTNDQNNRATDTDTILIPTTTSVLLEQTVCEGSPAQFSTAASGTGPFTFVWKKGITVLLSGINTMGNTSTLTLPNAQISDAGIYSVEVMGAAGNTVTQSATLNINPLPTVTKPTDQSVLQGGTATFSVTPGGTPAPTVKWQVSTDGGTNYNDIPLATGNMLTLNNVTAAMNGHRYRAIAESTCGSATSMSALLSVNAAGAKFDDPLVCLVGGDTGIITAFITNNGAAAVNASYSATNLAPNLIGIPGSGVASVNPANFIITPTSANWNGVLQPGETVNLLFRVQFAPGLLNGANVCFDATFDVGGNQAQQQICTILNCPVGGVNPAVSAQKPGSLLVFPYYTSKAATKADTRFTLTNLGTQMAYVHLFFIDGATCQPADQFLCLTPGASYSGKASETDGETTGWILALAVNQQGQPIQYNNLIGNAFVNDGEYVDNYGAEAFVARSPNVAAIQGATALLFFDGIGYDAVPNQFALEVQSPLNAANQRVVTVGLRGDLNASALTGAAQIGTGLVINGNETPMGSFINWLTGNCQAIATVTNQSPRVPLGMNGLIPNGQHGTIQFRIGGGVGLLMTPKTAPFAGIRALHKTGLTTGTLRIPLLPPVC